MTNSTLIVIEKLPQDRETTVDACARLMSQSEPWLTLKRTYADSLRILRDPQHEVYVAKTKDQIAGFCILTLTGSLVGYIRSLFVHPEMRGMGIGNSLMDFAENTILRLHPNIFLCVSSFNQEAQRFYLSRGYEVVGELRDYVVQGHDEILMRKSIGPMNQFRGKDLTES
jgi:ribosomal-protein-alanine N-acetyltransferase